MHRCSISVDSKPDNSGSEDTSDDENADVKVNGYHDAENEVDPETGIVSDRRHSGKLSESSGSAARDVYDYKVPYLPSLVFLAMHVVLMTSKLNLYSERCMGQS